MIQKIEILNFRCLRHVKLRLGALTVLVGPNASGKTAVLEALRDHVEFPRDAWQHREDSEISLHVTAKLTPDVRAPYVFSHSRVSSTWKHAKPWNYHLLHLDPSQLRLENRVEFSPRLDQHGANLSNLVASLTRTQQETLAKNMSKLLRVFQDVDVQPTKNGMHQIRFQDRWDANTWYSPEEVSDGTMLVTAYLALQHQKDHPTVLGIEEPERGLHPYLIGQLVKTLRLIADGQLGGEPFQVVLATHSAELLDYVQPDEVRFFDRSAEDGSVVISEVETSTSDWKRAFQRYKKSLSAAWLAGGLGGVPG